MKTLNKVALALCLAACMSIGFVDKAHAEEVMPSSGIAYEDLDREIHKLETVYSFNKNDWASVTDLSLLYYDRKEYKNSYKMSKRALKLYEKGYAYQDDDDILREVLVKGAAAAYYLGDYYNAENMLNKMIGLNLRGTDDHQKTYLGWAYYYLSNIERIRGHYNRSHYYGGIAINYCPHHTIFLDYWNGFYFANSIWHWHHHHHNYRPPMLPPRPIHHARPFHNYKPSVQRPMHQRPAHQSRPAVQRPVHQRPAVNQSSRPSVQRPVHQRPAINQSRPAVQRPVHQRPAHQSRPAVQRPMHQRPAVNQSRPAVQRPMHQRPAVNQSRPAVQRPVQQKPTQPDLVYQPKTESPRGYHSPKQFPTRHSGPRRR